MPAADPTQRRKATGALEEIMTQLERLKVEKSEKERHVDELRLVHQQTMAEYSRVLLAARRKLCGVADALGGTIAAFETKETEAVPLDIDEARESAIAAGRSMWIQPQTSDLGSEVKQMEQISEGVVEAYSLMAKAGQGLVWDAEKMDVIVNACQTDLFKARMDSNQAKVRMNQLRLMQHSKLYGMRCWIDFVHCERYAKLAASLVQSKDQVAGLEMGLDVQQQQHREQISTQHAHQAEFKVQSNIRRVQTKWVTAGWSAWTAFHRTCQLEKMQQLSEDSLLKEQEAHNEALAKEVEIKVSLAIKKFNLHRIGGIFRVWTQVLQEHKAAILAEQNEKELQALHQKEQDAKNIRIKRFAAAMLTNRTEGALRVTFSSLKSSAHTKIAARRANEARHRKGEWLQNMLNQKLMRQTLLDGLVVHARTKQAARVRQREIQAKLALTWKRHSMGLTAKTLSALKTHALACAAGRRMDLALGQASAQQDQANTAKADLHSNNKAMQRLSVGLRRWCQAINHTKVNAMYARFKREEARCEQIEQTLAASQHDLEQEKALSAAIQDKVNRANTHAQQLLEQLQLRDTQMAAKETEIDSLKQIIADFNHTLSVERNRRTDVERELTSVKSDRDRLEAEINVIVEEIGFVRNISLGQ